MKRSPLQRKTPLRAAKGMERKSAPKRPRLKGVPADVKAILLERSGGLCEVGLTCGGLAPAVHPAHREGKKAGGTSADWSNVPSNLLASCAEDHRLIDQVSPAGAERLGLKLRTGVARPWEVPVRHARLGWVLLDDQGGHRPAPAGSYADGRRPTPVIACPTWDLMVQAGAFIEAMDRYGHLQCPGWSPPREGAFQCGCGSAPFLLEVAA
jgi:hypothetical protein